VHLPKATAAEVPPRPVHLPKAAAEVPPPTVHLPQAEAASKRKVKDPLGLTFSIGEVTTLAKEAGGIIKIMTSMLSTVGEL
jgi:hypothetical protein